MCTNETEIHRCLPSTLLRISWRATTAPRDPMSCDSLTGVVRTHRTRSPWLLGQGVVLVDLPCPENEATMRMNRTQTRRSQRLLLGVPRRQRKVAAMMMMMTTTTTRQDPKVMANYPLVSLNTGESNVPALSGRNCVIAMGFQLICLAWLSMIPEVPLLAVLTTAIFLLGEEFNRRRCTRTCSYTSK